MSIKPSVMFKSMRAKVVGLLRVEAKMSIKERENQQWQLLYQIKGFGDYIVGKGGANTMFWIKDNGERSLCYPNDMIQLIDKWVAESEAVLYHIVVDKKSIASYPTPEEARMHKAKDGALIVVTKAGVKTKLFIRKQGLMGAAWKPLLKKN